MPPQAASIAKFGQLQQKKPVTLRIAPKVFPEFSKKVLTTSVRRVFTRILVRDADKIEKHTRKR
jgi:hypothetical protein